ncbi:integrin-linked protein kinase 1-like protein [Tanacetum coccineum]|uniref:Integrin-linked protein kinase 1-like protein n=1 Tax=Tanacetum coccineum TaxID=301880 RepID=A0ABQ4WYC2_9ASTR
MEEPAPQYRFTLGRQSSRAPERDPNPNSDSDSQDDDVDVNQIDPRVRLMFFSSEGNLDGIKELIEYNTDVNFKDIDDRTALHVAACQGFCDVAKLLLEGGAEVDSKDRWGSTDVCLELMPFDLLYATLVVLHDFGVLCLVDELPPFPILACVLLSPELSPYSTKESLPWIPLDSSHLELWLCRGYPDIPDLLPVLVGLSTRTEPLSRPGNLYALHYKNHDMVKLLEKHGAKPLMAPMHVKNAREVPEYEIAATELDFTGSVDITKGTFTIASWRGTKVAVKKLGDELFTDKDKVRAFRDELELLQKIRHPNVVQFLGAGDLRLFLKRKGALKPITALKFAMDIARGMNYLHENKPEPIIHRDLEPSNILRADSGHLKVADFGISELLKVTKTVKQGTNMSYHDTTWRYVAPEVFRNEDYDTKVDVFSFALILQEMIEGNQPFFMKNEDDVPKAYVANERPPFNAPSKSYAHGLKELIEECWHEKPDARPTFREIITRLESTYHSVNRRRRWKVRPLKWFQKVETIWKKEDSVRSSRDRSSHI